MLAVVTLRLTMTTIVRKYTAATRIVELIVASLLLETIPSVHILCWLPLGTVLLLG